MEASIVYSPLFNIDGQLDADLFQNMDLNDVLSPSPNDKSITDSLYTKSDEFLNKEGHDCNEYSPYFQYPQSIESGSSDNDFFYNHSIQQDTNDQDITTDYDYLQLSPASNEEKPNNFFYNPYDTYLPQSNNPPHEDSMIINGIPNYPSMNYLPLQNSITETSYSNGGMTRNYVSLREVNSFVAKADSTKHSLEQVHSAVQNDYLPPYPYHRSSFSSAESNEDSEDDDFFDSDYEFRWPDMAPSSYSTPTSKQKLMIKIKNPTQSLSVPNSANLGSSFPSQYGECFDQWDIKTVKGPKHRKSMPNIFNAAKKKSYTKGRRGSAPKLNLHKSASSISTQHSSSSLSSLTLKLQRSMQVSDSFGDFLSVHCSDDEHTHFMDEDDDEYDEVRSKNGAANSFRVPVKKGRNVDKACNHCKRSHLRCDDMRPCRRCVTTGKIDCQDVEHKPRGRPKLHKNGSI